MITKTTKIIKNALAATRFVSFVSFVLFVISVRAERLQRDLRVDRSVEPSEREGHRCATGRAGCVHASGSNGRCAARLREAAFVLPRDGDAHTVN